MTETAAALDEAAGALHSLKKQSLKLVIETIRIGLRIERTFGASTRFRANVVRLRHAMLRESDTRVALELLPPEARELRQSAYAITDLLGDHARLAETERLTRERDLDGAPTEAEMRRRVTPVARLMERGVLDEIDLRAAAIIRDSAQGVIGGECLATVRYDQPRVDVSRHMTYEPPAAMSQTYDAGVYREWCRQTLAAGEPLAAILDVVVNDKPLREVERRWCMRNGTLTDLLDVALARFAVMAKLENRGQ